MTSLLHVFGDTFPAFGASLLLGAMVVASYTFAVALAAGASGRARTLQAARFGAYGTVALIGTAVVCLAYAFVTHDFRIRYVAHYSDRSMPLHYLFTALWGGQDGSLLWWLFLLSAYIGVCVRWLGKRYLELQPYVIATLMAIVLFFCVLMAFAANPFATNLAGARADGEGLNPLLQNYWMVIHPPCLYTGFVGCSVPFAFAVAALVTGRLDHEWIVASRKWTLFAWMFLGIGNTLGMLWAYESLGWGGYWGWDPVENAAFMPFLMASAYVHSVMIQERRGPAEGVERLPRRADVLSHDLRHVPDSVRDDRERPRVRAVVDRQLLRGVPGAPRRLRGDARPVALARAARSPAVDSPAQGGGRVGLARHRRVRPRARLHLAPVRCR